MHDVFVSDELEIGELPTAVRRVAQAVEAAVSSDFTAAVDLLASIDEPGLRQLYLQRCSATRGLPRSSRAAGPYPKINRGQQLVVLERDRWRCRYDACGYAPVIDVDVLVALQRGGLFTYYTRVPKKVWHELG